MCLHMCISFKIPYQVLCLILILKGFPKHLPEYPSKSNTTMKKGVFRITIHEILILHTNYASKSYPGMPCATGLIQSYEIT